MPLVQKGKTMTDLNVGQDQPSRKPKRLTAKPESQSGDASHEGLDKLVDEFVGFDRELQASATEVNVLKKKDLGIVVRACQVLYKAKTRGKVEWIEFCERVTEKGVTLKGSRKRRYAKMGEHADRLNESIGLIKNESVALEIARLAELDYEKLKTSGKLTKDMTKGDLEDFLGRKRPSIFTLRLPKKRHSIPVKELCAKLTALVEEYPDAQLKGTGEFSQFSRSA